MWVPQPKHFFFPHPTIQIDSNEIGIERGRCNKGARSMAVHNLLVLGLLCLPLTCKSLDRAPVAAKLGHEGTFCDRILSSLSFGSVQALSTRSTRLLPESSKIISSTSSSLPHPRAISFWVPPSPPFLVCEPSLQSYALLCPHPPSSRWTSRVAVGKSLGFRCTPAKI